MSPSREPHGPAPAAARTADPARDERFMRLALAEARAARDADEVPVGALVVRGEEVLARAHNRVRRDVDPTAHAECLALRAAARALGAVRLLGCEVYSTVEPCFLCAGALVHARVARLVFAVRDPKFGGCVSLGRVLDHPGANHRLEFEEGCLADEARALLQEFFRARRAQQGGAAAAW
ncbi:MAG TPA: tRNA adenosine(34) deaminase TadA [Planctomycetota bacterium]